MELTQTDYNEIALPVLEQGFVFIKSGKSFHHVLLNDILYFEGEKEYVRVVTTSKSLLIYRRLKDIELQLGMPFIRVHNSYIINIKHLEKVEDNHVYIKGRQFSITKKFKDRFMCMIYQHVF